MGQAQEPISPTTQQLSVLVPITTNDDGEGVWQFQTPPAGVTWTGTLTVSGGVCGAVFDVYIGGALWGTFTGGAVFGPVQIRGQGSQQLVVNGSGLLQDTLYTMTLIGSSDADLNVQPIYPEPSGASTTVVQSNGGGSVSMDSRLTSYVTTSTARDRLPAMNVGDEVLLADAQLMSGNFVSWEWILADTIGDGQQRQWLVTMNEVSVLTPLCYPQIPLSSEVIANPQWNAYLSVSTNFVRVAGVKLMNGAPVLNNQILVSLNGTSNPQVQAITNSPRDTLAVTTYGGSQRAGKSGPLSVGVRYTVAALSAYPTTLYDGANWTFRLHAITWTGIGTSAFSLFDDYGLLFTVSGTTNSQPQFTDLAGLLTQGGNLYIVPSAAFGAGFQVQIFYDIVPIPVPTLPY